MDNYIKNQLDQITILSDSAKNFQYTILLQSRGERTTYSTNHINITEKQFFAIRKALKA